MIYEPREITCRDGRSCILRSAAVTDPVSESDCRGDAISDT